jgi:periodic tryptophan protein 2
MMDCMKCKAAWCWLQVYVWSLRTGRLLDVLAGHEGPVCCAAFNPVTNELCTGSWDKTVRTWDVFGSSGTTESLPHQHDVLALAVRPDGKQLASATLNGDINLWDPTEAQLQVGQGCMCSVAFWPVYVWCVCMP